MTLKISFFIPELGIGGAERTVIRLSNDLNRRGNLINIICINGGKISHELDDNIDISIINSPSVPQIGILSSVPYISRCLQKSSPDILISFMKHANIAALLSHRVSSFDFPIIVSERNHLSTSLEQKNSINRVIMKLMINQLYDHADQIVSLSEGVAEDLRQTTKISSDKITVIYNPVVSSKLKERSKQSVDHPWLNDMDTDVILGAGRLVDQKDFTTLISAFSLVADQHDNTRLIILGEGERRQELKEQIKQLGIEDIVQLPGQVTNPYPFMRSASVFVLSSAWEGFGNALVESMACGCPVVATDCQSGPREITNDGEYGSLVPVGDYEKMALEICNSLDEPLQETKFMQRAADFSVESISSQYLSLFEDIIN